nr:fimbrial protein [Luteimonas sp. JM171]
MAAVSGVQAAPSPGIVPLVAVGQVGAQAGDPAKQLPGAIAVDDIDFRRGDGGSGKLVLRFDGEGAAPDMRADGASVVIDVGNVTLPTALQRPLNVSDFATPVQRIDAVQSGTGTRIVLTAHGEYEPMAYQSGREYIVELVPRATTAERGVGATGVTAAGQLAAAAVEQERTYTGHPVVFNFQDVPVRTVLQMIAEESDFNIVASDSVQGNVTLRLDNVPWDQALDIILQAKGLDKRRNGNVIWIAPQNEIASYEQSREDARLELEERVEMITEYIPISYGNAEDIAILLTDESKSGQGGGANAGGGTGRQSRGFLSSRGSLSFDRRTNTLLVVDIPQRVATIRELVQQLDRPVDQVVIEARIVIANESFARDIGARFGVYGSDNFDRWVTSGNLDSNAGALGQAYDPDHTGGITFEDALNFSNPADRNLGAGSLALTILGRYVNWDMEISALQEEGRGEVISNPRIVTSNQREAVIRQGQEVGYLTVTGGQSNNIPTVQFKDVLLELKVTPTITNDGRVFLSMDITKDEIAGYTNMGAFGSVPNLNKRNITTAVLIEDGQTVSIGGVYEFRDRSEMSKVPFLADLPVIGNLFKRRGRDREKAELLIFVTPKVLRVAQR